MSVATLIEKAETANARMDDGCLLVLNGGPDGVLVTLRYDEQDDKFRAHTSDSHGRAYIAWANSKETAVSQSLDGYLDLLNQRV